MGDFIYMKSCEHLLLDVDKDPEHVLVHFQPLQQSCFTGKDEQTAGDISD